MDELRSMKHIKAEAGLDRVSALEARIVVLEIVSMSALAMAMDTSENADTEAARGMAGLIVETVDQRCNELGVSDQTREAARDYAHRLLGITIESLYSQSH
ncbi:hypothetical protein [Rhizobium sp. FKY42]|uniref:hypothetical protein n=1 Tax=Rhizobium sp. FKY42 TaxID=2562310 RepID=UPI0010BFA8C8|nr:hypothetical protein [Rhizobium sp. FKY42]